MVDVITPRQLTILRFVSLNPGVTRERLAQTQGATAADLAYLEQHDLIREREVGCFRISHLGDRALRRGL